MGGCGCPPPLQFLCVECGDACFSPPQLLLTDPEDGARAVAAGSAELRLVFDRVVAAPPPQGEAAAARRWLQVVDVATGAARQCAPATATTFRATTAVVALASRWSCLERGVRSRTAVAPQ